MSKQDFLINLFQYEDCACCGKGAEEHEVIELLGHPFALCLADD